jgi:hypothetical protein
MSELFKDWFDAPTPWSLEDLLNARSPNEVKATLLGLNTSNNPALLSSLMHRNSAPELPAPLPMPTWSPQTPSQQFDPYFGPFLLNVFRSLFANRSGQP